MKTDLSHERQLVVRVLPIARRDHPLIRSSRHNVTLGFSTDLGSVLNSRIVSSSITINVQTVRALVVSTLPRPVAPETNEAIFGPGGILDSLDLVNFLADLEYRIAEEFDRQVVLASEIAMSRSRSPFRDVAALTDYIVELLAQ